ncbi:hypothetical protein KUTeg_019989 [Tegillarca granosa]|uniref:Uncharacterized protein n=1 Tax=Tegillarca granosa TaxID=220873 RepID=A0ABQ9EE63_TEGGR|nr:hypothetical protein KUTeg_019989 [Tegillarca granosa]
MSDQYPLNNKRRDDDEKCNHVSNLATSQKWDELLAYLEEHDYEINHTRKSAAYEMPPSLMTPLHIAADSNAPKEVFQRLLDLNASRCLKTAKGKTAFDIAKAKGLSEDILDLLKIPGRVKEQEKDIEVMEKSLHALLRSHAGIQACLVKSRQRKPQLAYLFEFQNNISDFFYWVPGMHGGVTVTRHEKGIIVAWYSNIVSGSDECHFIKRDGTRTVYNEDEID